MWRTVLAILIFCLATPVWADRIFVSTEEYPPYNTRGADGRPTGVYMDQLKIIFQRAGIDYEATILPWARAIALAQTEQMHCVAAAARTPEREQQFKWVSPLQKDRNVLVALKDKHLEIKTMEDAKRHLVGTQRNDYTESALRSQGFSRIDLSADFDKTLSKLMAGRIDLMPMSESALKKLNALELREVTLLTWQELGMACHRSVPDEVIQKMQAALDELIADGTQLEIYEKYGVIIRK